MSTAAIESALAQPEISTGELSSRIGEQGLCVIDVRPLFNYNGWSEPGALRGGHIPGAVALPSAWLTRLDETELQELLVDKGITTGAEIVVYGSAEGTSLVRDRIAGSLDAPLRTYARWADWVADESLPLERLARYEKLVHYDWLWELLGGGRPEAAPEGRYLLFHVNFGVPEEYADGHLPGALYLDTNQLESPRDWNRRSPEDLEAALRALGITSDTTVILYGRDTEGEANEKWPGRRAGQIAATRAALILSYSGVEDVRLLDGGYDAWVQGGHPLETVPRFPTSVPVFGADVPVHPELIVDLDEAKQILADPEAPPSSASAPGTSTSGRSAVTTTSSRRAGSRATSGATAAPTRTTCSTTATSTTRCGPTPRSRPTGTRPGSRPTSGSPSTAAPAGARARPGSMPG